MAIKENQSLVANPLKHYRDQVPVELFLSESLFLVR